MKRVFQVVGLGPESFIDFQGRVKRSGDCITFNPETDPDGTAALLFGFPHSLFERGFLVELEPEPEAAPAAIEEE